MRRSFWLINIFFTTLNSFGQVADTSFYPSGKIKDVRFFHDNKIVRATAYKPGGEVKYSWDISARTFESFDAISYEDTLAGYFRRNCPDYTLFQHYGNGPLMEIENYKGNMRDGHFEQFDTSGKPIAKGQFSEWEKVGIWTYYDAEGKRDRHIHWFHHDYWEGGISIDYTITPIALTLLVISIALLVFLKYSAFSSFFLFHSLSTIGIFSILFSLGFWLSDSVKSIITRYIGNYVLPVLATLAAVMIVTSLVALIFRRVGIKLILAILFLLIGIGLCYLLFISYIYSKLSGVMLG